MQKQRLALAAMDAKTRPLNSIINTKRDCKLRKIACRAVPQKPTSSDEDLDGNIRRVLQTLLWVAEGVYILWLFLLPYAPVGTSATVFLFFLFPTLFLFLTQFDFFFFFFCNFQNAFFFYLVWMLLISYIAFKTNLQQHFMFHAGECCQT